MYTYFKKELYLYLIMDTQKYSPNSLPPPVAKVIEFDFDTMTYQPIMYLSDYWLLKRDLIMVNESVPELNLTLHFDTYSLNYFIMQK